MSEVITAEKLAEIRQQHEKWLNGEGGTRANLRGADLSGANLSGADLSGANLRGTCLDPNLLELQRAFVRACPADADGYRIVYRTAKSQHCGNTVYEPGKTYDAPYVSADIVTECHPGIYAGSLEWMRDHYGDKPLVKGRVRDGDYFISSKGAIRTAKLEVLEAVE